MKLSTRILTVFLVLSICFTLATPAHADGILTDAVTAVTSFADWLAGRTLSEGATIGNFIWSLVDEDHCAGDGSNGAHSFVEQTTLVDGQVGQYYVCEYCGKTASEVCSTAYSDYVAELPAQSITSDGGYVIELPGYDYSESISSYCTLISRSPDGSYPYSIQFSCDTFNAASVYAGFTLIPPGSSYYTAPISGTYTWYVDILSAVNCAPYSYNFCRIIEHCEPRYFNSGSNIDYFFYNIDSGLSYFGYISLNALSTGFCSYTIRSYLTVIPVVPIDVSSGDTYNVDNRATSFTGNYGIIGDNGSITEISNTTIVNETNNSYINPATGESYTINDWSYDYSDRSYTLNLDNGTTSTVTYGDEYVSINETSVVEGDTITNNYTVYYIIEGDCPGDPDDPQPSDPVDPDDPDQDTPSHSHDWQMDSETDATCVMAGRVHYTCDACGEEKTELLPALGHSWEVKQTVPTQYDEDGNLLQQGYTIYKCSVCGEEYKDEDGTGPPGSSSDDDDDGIWDGIGDVLGAGLGGLIRLIGRVLASVLDALAAVVGMAVEKLGVVIDAVLSMFTEIPGLFGGFLDFLAAVFPFLPPEIMTLLTFGIAVIVAIGIIKALRR